MSNSQIQEVALQASAIGSSLLLLSMSSPEPLSAGLLGLSQIVCGGALGAMLLSYPGRPKA